ncbi:MAG: hypothetical protein JO219_00770 [Candidatus Eremiobacteraeota bacterium]|nr:hypothetical protein [Candidatus Eremiobacteraeota bacterium]
MFAGSTAAAGRLAAIASAFALSAALATPFAAAAASAPAQVAAAPVAAAPGGACGSVEVDSANSKDVLADENCFSKAYATCDPAMFAVAWHGSDASVARTFQTMRDANSDTCEVAEVVDHYKGSTLASSNTYLCNDVKQGGDGLTFKNCGADGDVFVPANLTAANARQLITIAYARQQAA